MLRKNQESQPGMRARQVVFSFFRYRGAHAPSAFLLMGFQGFVRDADIPSGMVKLMGCGAGDGFSVVPDLSTYCLVCASPDPDGLERIKRSRFYRLVSEPAMAALHFHLTPTSGRGTWDGQEFFAYSRRQNPDRPCVVLTRARVARPHLLDFWRQVPIVRRQLHRHPGCCYAHGIGEHPLLSLATFSVWENLDRMRAFAYRHSPHHDTARLAMRDRWLSESLFARFELEHVEGDLRSHPELERLLSARTPSAARAA